jgi:hypothetical protein
MINDDILIKYSIKRIEEGHLIKDNWVDYTRLLRDQINFIKSGFPGIGDGDLSIITYEKIMPGMRVILDDNLDLNRGEITDSAALLVLVKDVNTESGLMTFEIEGIGAGEDLQRDPDRKLKWRDIYTVNLNSWYTILKMDSKPREDGGSVYYYYNKSCRDYRY